MAAAAATACLAAFSLATFVPPAQACGNSYIQVYLLPQAIRRIERVESLLARGRSRAAYAKLSSLPHIKGLHRKGDLQLVALKRRGPWLERGALYGEVDTMPGDRFRADTSKHEALRSRVLLLHAVLTARVDGQVSRRSGRLARRVHPKVRQRNLTEALATVTRLHKAASDDARIEAYFAEVALKADPSQAAAAKRSLRALAERDLLGDPGSWLALARVEAGDKAETALSRCRALAGKHARRACRL